MFKTTMAALAGFAIAASSLSASAQTFFVDDFDSGDPGRYLAKRSDFFDYVASLGATPRDPAQDPWVWAFYKESGSVHYHEELNSQLVLYSNSSRQVFGGGYFTHHNNADFNFFGPDGADPATFRRVFSISDIQIGGSAPVDGEGDPTYTGAMADNYFMMNFTVSSGQGWQDNGTAFNTPSISAWVDGARGFGLIASRYTPATLAAFAPYTVHFPLVQINNATVPLTPTSIVLELGPQTYRLVFVFTGGGLYFEGEHGLDKAGWHWYKTPQTDTSNPDNFYVGLGASSISRQLAISTVKIGKVTVTDGQP